MLGYLATQPRQTGEGSFFPVKITWAYIAPVDKIVSQLDNICV